MEGSRLRRRARVFQLEEMPPKRVVVLDDAIAAIGLGKYQYRLLGVIAVLVMTEAMEVNLLAFLSPCVAEMHAVFRKAESSNLQAVREKYSHAKFLCVSTLTPPENLP